jgi:hypothetical protein
VTGVLFLVACIREEFFLVKGSRRKRHGLQVRRALHAGVPEIITRRTYNPRCLRLEMFLSTHTSLLLH